MVDPERPLSLAMVIWFGSLEFMSLGHGYDMVLLSPRHPNDADHVLSQPGGALRRYRRSRLARAARRRRARCNHRHRLVEAPVSETGPHATASRRYDPRDRRPHMHPSYYYFSAPDSDSADDTYDPTRKCFNIDGASTSDSEDEAPVEGRNTPP
jgi:hypothetical protein